MKSISFLRSKMCAQIFFRIKYTDADMEENFIFHLCNGNVSKLEDFLRRSLRRMLPPKCSRGLFDLSIRFISVGIPINRESLVSRPRKINCQSGKLPPFPSRRNYCIPSSGDNICECVDHFIWAKSLHMSIFRWGVICLLRAIFIRLAEGAPAGGGANDSERRARTKTR